MDTNLGESQQSLKNYISECVHSHMEKERAVCVNESVLVSGQDLLHKSFPYRNLSYRNCVSLIFQDVIRMITDVNEELKLFGLALVEKLCAKNSYILSEICTFSSPCIIQIYIIIS